jgi:hypothetical protein
MAMTVAEPAMKTCVVVIALFGAAPITSGSVMSQPASTAATLLQYFGKSVRGVPVTPAAIAQMWSLGDHRPRRC